MYNKIFTKILDSSIWLEPTPTRIVWLTMLAAMDEDGFCQFASVPNLAHRAILSLPETTEAVCVLESPDENSSDPDNEGRRIEKVPGGWMVLNAIKYREMVTRSVIQEQTRRRVAAHRERKKSNAPVTPRNAKTTKCNAPVTQSDTDTDTGAEGRSGARSAPRPRFAPPTLEEWRAEGQKLQPWTPDDMDSAWDHYNGNGWKTKSGPVRDWRSAQRNCWRRWKKDSANSETGQPNDSRFGQIENKWNSHQ